MREITKQPRREIGSSRWLGLVPSCVVLLVGLAALTAMTAMPKAWSGQIALIFPPTMEKGQVIRSVLALGARPVRVGAFGNFIVVDLAGSTSYGELRRHGVWLAIDPLSAGACLRLLLEPRAGSDTAE